MNIVIISLIQNVIDYCDLSCFAANWWNVPYRVKNVETEQLKHLPQPLAVEDRLVVDSLVAERDTPEISKL